MSEDVQIQVAVLAAQFKTLVEDIRADRAANEEFRKELRESHSETRIKLATVQSSLDMAKGGWKVLVIIGGFVSMVIAAMIGLLKVFYHA